MKKKVIWGVVALAAGMMVLRASPYARTKTYFTFQRTWRKNWPLSKGLYFPVRLQPLFTPFVPVRMEVEPGVNLLLDPDDYVARSVLDSGQWEKESWDAIERHLPAGGTFVDVGAHIGYYSLKADRVVGEKGRVIAVEPNPDTLVQLRENIEASGAKAITVQPVACSDAEATLELFAAARANTGVSSLSRDNAQQAGTVNNVYKVRARPLDDVIRETGVSRVDVIKIDVEGAELLVLKGAPRTLEKFGPALVVEYIDKQLQAMGASTAKLDEYLRSFGYTPRGLIASKNMLYSK